MNIGDVVIVKRIFKIGTIEEIHEGDYLVNIHGLRSWHKETDLEEYNELKDVDE